MLVPNALLRATSVRMVVWANSNVHCVSTRHFPSPVILRTPSKPVHELVADGTIFFFALFQGPRLHGSMEVVTRSQSVV
ncbi:hypothetical protein CTRI78_v003095 [Colletotrichum trifolii]|uniref:Uncharacterized protein n=1 Tax=Colletotrichum trifolii TaxID=5466 RepID=A0A4V3HWT7_COLTR|nr:hypothetical protein CTRI78_v003095 [Colletotrichum trifolii]